MAITKDHDKLFSRLVLMMDKLSNERFASLKDLAYEYNVDERTIRRDVDKLHFFPISVEKSVVKLADGFYFEGSRLLDRELMVTELALNSIRGINEDIDAYMDIIRAKVSHPTFFSPYHVKAEIYQQIDMDSDLLNKIEDAITKSNISKIKSNDVMSVVYPYKVVAFDGIWYLLAKDEADEKIKTFLIANIKEFRATTSTYKVTGKDISSILENVHSAWFEDGNSFEVKIRVKPKVAHIFKLKDHLSSQKILKENSDGSLIVTYNVSTDEDVDNLIKAWLPHVEILKPERFRKKIVNELESYLKELKEYNKDL